MKDDLTKKLIAGISIGIGIPVVLAGIMGWIKDVNEASRYYQKKKWDLQ